MAGVWLLLAGALAGCSAVRLAYSQAGDLAYWWLDGYVDFNGNQSLKTKEALAHWLAWHRRDELPVYSTLLERAANEMASDFTAAQACGWAQEGRKRLDAAAEQALPAAAAIAATFDAQQLAHLQSKQARSNDDFRDEFLQDDPAKRQRVSIDRAVDRTEQLYGRLDAAQRERLAAGVAASPFDPLLWLGERERRQRDLHDVIGQLQSLPTKGAPSEAGTALMRGYWQRVTQSPDPAYRGYMQRLETYNCAFFAELHNAMTAKQRQTAQTKLRGWAADARQLAGTS